MTEELKTLHDLVKIGIKGIGAIDIATMKVVSEKVEEYDSVDVKELRAEAIKWVKYFDSNKGGYVPNSLDSKYDDSGYDEYASHAYRNIIRWIRDFFNIADEDLK